MSQPVFRQQFEIIESNLYIFIIKAPEHFIFVNIVPRKLVLMVGSVCDYPKWAIKLDCIKS